jgi:ATP-dependent protease ClpP protease subunit
MSRLMMLVLCGTALLMTRSWLAPSSVGGTAAQALTVRAEAELIVLAWNGQIAEPMRDEIAAAIARYTADPRRLVIALNSPGGSMKNGLEVMMTIREAARLRRIDTRVERGAVCASMCVPVYLLGAERTADPEGYFMFHEASVDISAEQEATRKGPAGTARVRRFIETIVTDAFYGKEMSGDRVDARWLREMRANIIGRDIWMSARRLMDDRSGIVDALVPTRAR